MSSDVHKPGSALSNLGQQYFDLIFMYEGSVGELETCNVFSSSAKDVGSRRIEELLLLLCPFQPGSTSQYEYIRDVPTTIHNHKIIALTAQLNSQHVQRRTKIRRRLIETQMPCVR